MTSSSSVRWSSSSTSMFDSRVVRPYRQRTHTGARQSGEPARAIKDGPARSGSRTGLALIVIRLGRSGDPVIGVTSATPADAEGGLGQTASAQDAQDVERRPERLERDRAGEDPQEPVN